MIFGAAIDVGPGPGISLGPGGPWPPLLVAAVPFAAAAALKPMRHRSGQRNTTALGTDSLRSGVGALGPGHADFAQPTRQATPLPRHRAE